MKGREKKRASGEGRRRRRRRAKKKEHYGVRGDSIAITLTHVECRSCRVGNYNSASRSRGLMHFGWGGRGGRGGGGGQREGGGRAMVFTRTIVDSR